MSIKSAKLIVIVFIIIETAMLTIRLLEKDTGSILILAGSILITFFAYHQPKALISTKLSELRDHSRNLKKVDHIMVWCSISLMVSGIYILTRP
jgi:amino acid transporter